MPIVLVEGWMGVGGPHLMTVSKVQSQMGVLLPWPHVSSNSRCTAPAPCHATIRPINISQKPKPHAKMERKTTAYGEHHVSIEYRAP